MKSRESARHAYVEAEVVTGLAHQIRAIRLQRKWTQSDLAKRLGTSQTVISRLEDPSYGKYSLQTLVDLAKVFDTGMQVKFISLVTMLQETFKPNTENRSVPSFEEESGNVAFFRASKTGESGTTISIAANVDSSVRYLKIEIPKMSSKNLKIDINSQYTAEA